MDVRQLLILGASMLASSVGGAVAGGAQDPYVRVAEIEIDPAQLEAYKAAAKEEIEASVRLEPGLLALYAVSGQGRSGPRHGVRDVCRRGCVQVAPRDAPLQELQDHDARHGPSPSSFGIPCPSCSAPSLGERAPRRHPDSFMRRKGLNRSASIYQQRSASREFVLQR